MVLLKALEFEQSSGKKSIFNLSDIAAEAKKIIEDARREGQRMLRQAQQDITRTREQAQAEGYQSGHDQGLTQGRQEGHAQALQEAQQDFTQHSKDCLGTLRAICEQFGQDKGRLLWQAEQNTVALAVAIARLAVKKSALISPEVAVENVKAALELTAKTTNVVVHVNPKDKEHVEKMLTDTQTVWAQYTNIAFEPDEAVTPGSCRLTTEQGEIDGQLDTQIDRIAAELLTTDGPDDGKTSGQAEVTGPQDKDG